jgi:hypothetical protein
MLVTQQGRCHQLSNDACHDLLERSVVEDVGLMVENAV